jgi:prephenate dehydratase
MTKKYAIQGFAGSFHEEALHKYCGAETDTVYCSSFAQAFKATTQQAVHGAVIAIENSIAGSILPNYSLLQKSKLFIVGEIYLPIKQHLLVNRGVHINDINEVHSHPMALLQCSEYLQQYKWKLVETEDTALSAKYIKQHRCKHIAAVASSMAGTLYNLETIVSNIHTDKKNSTRFLILEKQMLSCTDDRKKASLYFETKHEQGSLANVLIAIAKEGINISKLQSSPVVHNPFHYYFHIDLEFEQLAQLNAAIVALQRLTANYKLYGIYKNNQPTRHIK